MSALPIPTSIPVCLALGLWLSGVFGGGLAADSAAGTPAAAGARAADAAAPPVGSAEEQIRTLLNQGRYREAEKVARTHLAGVEAAHGPESIEAAGAVDRLVAALIGAGRAGDPASVALGRRAVEIKERLLGPEDAKVAFSLNSLGKLLLLSGNVGQGKRAFERALEIQNKALGPADPEIAGTLIGIAYALSMEGDYPGGRALEERVVDLLETAHGPEHPEVALALINLGTSWFEEGDYDRAQALYERALEIQGNTVGPGHPEVSQSLQGLGNVRRSKGDLAGARGFFERALAIKETALGPEHPEVAEVLNNLAIVLSDMNEMAEARRLHERALRIREKSLGPDHPDLTGTLTNLAELVELDGDTAGARAMYERALSIREKALGPDNARLAFTLDGYAQLLTRQGDLEKARRLYERSLALFETGFGAEHYYVGLSLGNLGELRAMQGERSEALALLRRGLEILEKSAGAESPDVARVLNALAQVQWADGRAREALETSLRAEVMAREQFERTVRNLSEREALQYEQGRVSGFDVALSSLAAPGSGRPPAGAVARVWEEVIRSRALVLDEMAARHQPQARRQDAEEKALAAELEAAGGRLARLAVRRPAGEDPARRESSLAAARSEKERAERALAEKRAARRAAREPAQAGLAWVSRALPEGAALVAYLKYSQRSGSPKPAPARAAGSAAPGKLAADAAPSYAAFVLPAGGGEPIMVPLGPAAEIEARVGEWMSGVSGAPRGLALRREDADAAYRRAGERLRRAVWDPLARHLRRARQVFVVPDGALHLVSLVTLPDGEDRYLVESGPLLHYLAAERDLARAETALGRGLLVLGDPDFDAGREEPSAPGGLRPSGSAAVPAAAGMPAVITAAAPASPALPPAASVSRALFRGGPATCSDLHSLRFEPLAGSRAEAEEIASLWMQKTPGADVVKLTDARAGEAEFKREAAGRRIIHVATHGFFADDRCLLDPQRTRGSAPAAGSRQPDSAPGAAGNPLLLSGLALAGANRRESAPDDGEDGILTAEEVAALDLSGVEWAVLSACETGIGQVQAGEGVLGLRRAFEVAGARTLILSLWPVEDAAAREWMRGLYQGRLEGLTTAQAVRQASLKVIQRRRQAGRSAHPAFWGAFVATGDWR